MLTILNDTHLDAERSAGTTPATRQLLKQRTLDKFQELLPRSGDLMILGDLFDTADVSAGTLLSTYRILYNWLLDLEGLGSRQLYMVAGNHDLKKSSNQLSSFDLLCGLLEDLPGMHVIKGGGQMTPYGYAIPHMPNQDLFDLELEKVPECDFLFVHCNIHNNFAAQSDQSLNMSLDQIRACKAQRIVCAHEHHARALGKVVIPGNQIATSVSDWLSPGDKQFAVIDCGELTLHTCARRDDEFVEMAWDALADTDVPFVRIGGAATAEQASAALAAVAAYRRRSDALVVTNAVKIEAAGGENYEDAVASMAGFDVMAMLRDVLTADEMKILEKL